MRLFVGLPLPAECRPVLARLACSLASFPVRPVKPENVHLTLLFLGEVDSGRLPSLLDALASLRFAPFPLVTTRFGFFSSVFWLGVSLTPELSSLDGLVRRSLAPFAFREDRPFSPHLTLARFRRLGGEDRRRLLRSLGAPPRFSWRVSSFVLFESRLGRGGADYFVIRSFPAQEKN